jgi:6-phosphofructokinase
MQPKNILYAQSGGVTSVINASAAAIIEEARLHPNKFNKIYAARNGIIGALNNELIDTAMYSLHDLKLIKQTPGGVFGSCRYQLKENSADYNKLLEVFKKNEIGYFFYNGGGDSMDTANKVNIFAKKIGYPLTCIGVPKTIDNDLPFTDCCPGFGSVAKYIAISVKEASLDVESMAESSTKVFILEVMGRHAGWLAASSALANIGFNKSPHIILFPEVTFNEAKFLEKVQESVEQHGFCVIVTAEGVKNSNGEFLSESGLKDAFGHKQLGGVAPILAKLIKEKHKYKYHWAVADYLQRSARHIASLVDVEHAIAVGKAAVKYAYHGMNGIMPVIKRISNSPYKWEISLVALDEVANKEHFMPKNYISDDGFGITAECREYLAPLIVGEAYPTYANGVPEYFT